MKHSEFYLEIFLVTIAAAMFTFEYKFIYMKGGKKFKKKLITLLMDI